MRSSRTDRSFFVTRKRVMISFVVALVILGALLREFLQGGIEDWWLLWDYFERLSTNARGLAEYLHLAGGIVFVRLPVGRALGVGSSSCARQRFSPSVLLTRTGAFGRTSHGG